MTNALPIVFRGMHANERRDAPALQGQDL